MTTLNALMVEECPKGRILEAIREAMEKRGFRETEGMGEVGLRLVLENERRALLFPETGQPLEPSTVLEISRALGMSVKPVDVDAKISRNGTTLKRTLSELRSDGSLRILDARQEYQDGQTPQGEALWLMMENSLLEWFEAGRSARMVELWFDPVSFTGNARLDGIVVALRNSKRWKRDAGPGGTVQFLAEDGNGLRQGFFVSEAEAAKVLHAMKSRYAKGGD